jgi:hypothetical protein
VVGKVARLKPEGKPFSFRFTTFPLTASECRKHYKVIGDASLLRFVLIFGRNFRTINDENIYGAPLGVQF